MTMFNQEQTIEILSHLVELILYCRLTNHNDSNMKVASIIAKLEALDPDDRFNLKIGIQIISKLHYHSAFQVKNFIEKHLKHTQIKQYSILVQIFEFYNKQQQQIFFEKRTKKKVIEKWVFQKQRIENYQNQQFSCENQLSDIVLTILYALHKKQICQKQSSNKNLQLVNNTTLKKGYQLIIKSQCSKTGKNNHYVFHHSKNLSQLFDHSQCNKISILQFQKYWKKTIRLQHNANFSIGIYFIQSFNKQSAIQMETQLNQMPHNDRKYSAETKAEQNSKGSISSLNLSFEKTNSQKINGINNIKPSTIQFQRNNNSDLKSRNQRTRFQSIYQTKDQDLNVFILSPRKLSIQQCSQIKSFQQKTICFEIQNHKHGPISEQVMQQILLDAEQQISNLSSEGFQMLEENDIADSVIQETQRVKSRRQAQVKQQVEIQSELIKRVFRKINILEGRYVELLRSVDQLIIF